MLQNPCKTLGFKKNMVYKIPPGGGGGGGKPYPANGLLIQQHICSILNIGSLLVIERRFAFYATAFKRFTNVF